MVGKLSPVTILERRGKQRIGRMARRRVLDRSSSQARNHRVRAQALAELGGDDLEDDLLVERGLSGEPHARLPAAAGLPLDAVAVGQGGLQATERVGYWAAV
jgi:hypothetical protein